jgi:hypothetical protein
MQGRYDCAFARRTASRRVASAGLLVSALLTLSSVASSDHIQLRAESEHFLAGTRTNTLDIRFINESPRQGLQLDLAYDAAVGEPVDVHGVGRLREPAQVYYSISPPGALHLLVYGAAAARAPLDAGDDAIASVTFAIPTAVPQASLRVSVTNALAASDGLAPVPIPTSAVHVPILGFRPALGEPGSPAWLALYQNAPNPITSSTSIGFDVPRQAHVRLAVYDVAGRLVRVLQDTDMPPGRYSSVWDGHGSRGETVANGIYFYVVELGRERIARKAVLSQ